MRRTYWYSAKHALVVAACVMAGGLYGTAARAGNGISSVAYKLEPGYFSVGARCFVHGDADSNAVGRIFYRLNGSQASYDSGMVLVRRPGTTTHCARMLHLQPATTVQFYVEFTDPTSGVTTTTADTISSRAWMAAPVADTTYYVSTAGDDDNDGRTRERPVRTIHRGFDLLKTQSSGTVVLMGPGTWYERNLINWGSPTAQNRYALIGDGSDPDSIIIDGSYEPTARNGYVNGSTPLAWESLGDSVWRCYFPRPADSCRVLILGNSEYVCPKDTLADVLNNAYGEPSGFCLQNDSLYVKRANGQNPSSMVVHAGYQPYLLNVEKPWWYFGGFSMRFVGQGPLHNGWNAAIKLGGWSSEVAASHAHIHNVRVYGCLGPAFWGLWDTDEVAIDSCRTDGLTIGAMPYEASKGRNQEAALVTASEGRAWTVAYNRFLNSHNEVWTGPADGDTTAGADYEVVYNTVSGYEDDGLEMDGGTGINGLLGWNTCTGGHSAISLAPVPIGPIYVLYNQGWSLTGEGFKLGSTTSYPSPGYVLIAHNTIATNGSTVPALWDVGGGHQNTHLRNNVLRSGTGMGGVLIDAVTPSDSAGVFTNDANYDVIDSTSAGGRLVLWVQNTYYSLPSLQSSLGWEKNGVAGASALANPANGDLSLTANSLAINAAQRLPGINTPALGQTFFSGAIPDAGALEYTDITPPSIVGDLVYDVLGSTGLTLNWTAPGDDGSVGTAAGYDLRWYTSAINAGNWASATQIATSTPGPNGTLECATVTGIAKGHTYYFALESKDAAENWSDFSNVASATTLASGPNPVCSEGSKAARPVQQDDAPDALVLARPHPNPARGLMELRYGVPHVSDGRELRLVVYDLQGRRTRSIAAGVARAGYFDVIWDLRGEDGLPVRTGVYFVRFVVGETQLKHAVVVIR